MNKENINPCLCGGKAEVRVTNECFGHGDYSKKAYVTCSSCHVKIGDIYEREIPGKEMELKAIELWNRYNPYVEDVSFSWPSSIKEWKDVCDQRLYARMNYMTKRKNNHNKRTEKFWFCLIIFWVLIIVLWGFGK